MADSYPIIEVSDEMRYDSEPLGSKQKFWFKHENQNWLFKVARKNTGEDWSEKAASEVATLMGLPTHHAELAIWKNKRGCAVRSFLKTRNETLVHGNELLGVFIANYDMKKTWGQSEHTFDNIVDVFEKLFGDEASRTSAPLRMVGYLVLDALIGNTDRHHQNWGVVLKPHRNLDGIIKQSITLAPTFDHASSLGRELLDSARERHLSDKTVGRYIKKGRGAIFAKAGDRHGLSPINLAELLADRFPELFVPWQKRVADIELVEFNTVLNRIPDERISESGRAFALAFFATSREMILEL